MSSILASKQRLVKSIVVILVSSQHTLVKLYQNTRLHGELVGGTLWAVTLLGKTPVQNCLDDPRDEGGAVKLRHLARTEMYPFTAGSSRINNVLVFIFFATSRVRPGCFSKRAVAVFCGRIEGYPGRGFHAFGPPFAWTEEL